ncbi:MAG: potassium-transporting ATPase subunit F [Chlorobiaceae bacterium]|nr:potassium-transporting ATPase subunit F [Chlorobiaceae bacterium]NTV61196.1 potassium-transporting ATPase subunit F [Chlorobiaceae bacterium]
MKNSNAKRTTHDRNTAKIRKSVPVSGSAIQGEHHAYWIPRPVLRNDCFCPTPAWQFSPTDQPERDTVMNIIVLVTLVACVGYLLVAILNPEKF